MVISHRKIEYGTGLGTTVVIELPDYTLAAGNGVKTIDGVTATFTAGEATATATFSVKVTY